MAEANNAQHQNAAAMERTSRAKEVGPIHNRTQFGRYNNNWRNPSVVRKILQIIVPLYNPGMIYCCCNYCIKLLILAKLITLHILGHQCFREKLANGNTTDECNSMQQFEQQRSLLFTV